MASAVFRIPRLDGTVEIDGKKRNIGLREIPFALESGEHQCTVRQMQETARDFLKAIGDSAAAPVGSMPPGGKRASSGGEGAAAWYMHFFHDHQFSCIGDDAKATIGLLVPPDICEYVPLRGTSASLPQIGRAHV